MTSLSKQVIQHPLLRSGGVILASSVGANHQHKIRQMLLLRHPPSRIKDVQDANQPSIARRNVKSKTLRKENTRRTV
jgi:hypothetical protein